MWPRTHTAVHRAITAFRNGQPILVHDHQDREGETDLIYPAHAVTPQDVVRLRNDAGGLICVALGDSVAESWDLPFLSEEISHAATSGDHRGYDERSSFSLTVNHRETYTGITDEDRALTISELGHMAANPKDSDFVGTFQVPGHVHLLRGAPNDIENRQGHTELALAVAEEANQPPAAVVCEMLDDTTGAAFAPGDAKVYGIRHDIPYVEGEDLLRVLR